MRKKAYKLKSRQILHRVRAKHKRPNRFRFIGIWLFVLASLYLAYPLISRGMGFVCNRISSNEIFMVGDIEITGNQNISAEKIIEASGIEENDNILLLDLEKVRDNIAALPRIEEVTVRRIFPSTLKITMKERIPKAFWFHDDEFYLIDTEGSILQRVPEKEINYDYILVAGENANLHFIEILNCLQKYPFADKVISVVRVGNRRWDIYMNNSLLVKLPEKNTTKALDILSHIMEQELTGVSVIDLRLIDDRIYFKLSNKTQGKG